MLMSDVQRDPTRLQAELAQLRVALHGLHPPLPDEAALRAQFREVARRREQASATAARGASGRRMRFAAAAAVVLAVGALLAVVLVPGERPAETPVAAAAPSPAPLPVSAFQPLLNAPGLSSSSYSVVRVRIPLAAFAVVPGTQQDGVIEADLLVGEDGLARGIRFPEADALLVSTARQ
jgi:hypothetical protein